MDTREAIAALVPHQGLMCLWERVLAWDEGHIVLASDGHRDPRHPLRRDGCLHAVHLCEYGAQAMAVHGGLLGRGRGEAPRPGRLVALRDVRLHVARIDRLAGPLRGEAEVLMQGEDSQQYAFRILHEGSVLAEGRAAVMLAPHPA
ncbi:phosphotransferase [Xanthomonas massiliensis]|uniref:phosphotransferase n=1 Tax=Xanthomonas massiliensis TaxID=1720302 RepID=UPI0008256F8F|nr:phosphotransferase [Xanthomonas massiliensis]